MKIVCLGTIIILTKATRTSSFVSPSPVRRGPPRLASIPNTETKSVRYHEESRRHRRIVYTQDDWVKHRSSDRFFSGIKNMFASGIEMKMGKEVLVCFAISTFLCLFHALFAGYTDLDGIEHTGPITGGFLSLLSVPMVASKLSSSSVGILLDTFVSKGSFYPNFSVMVPGAEASMTKEAFFAVILQHLLGLLFFRTNTSYQRWDEALKNWSMNISHARDLVRMGCAYYNREGVPQEIIHRDLNRLALCTWAYVRATKRHLSPEWEDEEAFQQELNEKLPRRQAEKLIAASHRPLRALQDLSFAIESLPMSVFRKNELHKAASYLEDNLGSNERLLTSPLPLSYAQLSSAFTALWAFFLPFGLYTQFSNTWNHIGLIPASTLIASVLFGIEDVANQLEEPFTILPMQLFCDKIYDRCREIISWEPNDNRMFSEEYISEIETFKQQIAANSRINIEPFKQVNEDSDVVIGSNTAFNSDKEREVELAEAEAFFKPIMAAETLSRKERKLYLKGKLSSPKSLALRGKRTGVGKNEIVLEPWNQVNVNSEVDPAQIHLR